MKSEYSSFTSRYCCIIGVVVSSFDLSYIISTSVVFAIKAVLHSKRFEFYQWHPEQVEQS